MMRSSVSGPGSHIVRARNPDYLTAPWRFSVRADAPPMIVFHGTGDTVTPFAGAKAFRDAIIKAGNRCELVVDEGGAYGYLYRDRAHYEEALRKTEAFLASLGLRK